MARANRGPQLIGVNSLFLVLAVVSMAMRCYVRIKLVKAFGMDDWLMLAATVSFIVYISLSLSGVSHGTGQHHAELPADEITTAISYWFTCQLFYALTMIVSKMSIGYFLVRVTVKRLHAWIIYGAVAISIVAGITFFFVVLFQCQPVPEYWMRYGRGAVGPVDDGSGKCLNVEIIIALAYLYSACSIIADFTLALLPAWIISSLKMDRRSKMLLIPLVGMGTIASAGLVVRSPYLLTFRDPDFLFATVDIAIWSTVEQGLAITAGSLATTRPLLRSISVKLGLAATSNRNTIDNLGGGGGISGNGGYGKNNNSIQMHNRSKSRGGLDSYGGLSSGHHRGGLGKDGGSWDGLDSDPEDGGVVHVGSGGGDGLGSKSRRGSFGDAMMMKSPMSSSAAAVVTAGAQFESRNISSRNGGMGGVGGGGSRKVLTKKHDNNSHSRNESQEELQSSGLSNDNVVITRSFLITDERM